ncbi:MAG: alpha-hydroxy acid oxidase [Immundisolibacter sp.]|uniref:alpha-hydroxy acid oxidase n=1 Tax=Immundisolibacter sp. TaxID=1934948 RepID=UPI003D11AA1C
MTAVYASVDDLRRAARGYLPRMVFDFVDGGAEREITLRANLADFEPLRFSPRVLTDVSAVELGTTLLGEPIALPLAIAPMGLCGLVRPEGELALARAAKAAGIPMVLSTAASHALESVMDAAPGNLSFQLYIFRDREFAKSLVQRARAAGYRALVVTVDLTRGGKREKDIHNGFTVPPRFTRRTAMDLLRHPAWLARMAPHRKQTLGNLVDWGGRDKSVVALSTFMNTQIDPGISWADLEWLRGEWDLPLVVKGILHPDDARQALALGADAIIVSNHGGRQLDGAPSSISALPRIADAVGNATEIILDSGVRRGADMLKALALGARACMIGKAALYGLGADGEAGVARVLTILRQEFDVAMALSGNQRAAAVRPDTLLP